MNIRTRVGWGSRHPVLAFLFWVIVGIVIGFSLSVALEAKPLYAQNTPPEIPEPPIPAIAFTGLFFADNNGNGTKQAEESMVSGFYLVWEYTDKNNNTIGAPANSNANGEFVTNMEDCPCDWKMTTNGKVYSGRAETYISSIYVPVPITTMLKTYLPLVSR
jgi:hypothetical protein